MGWGSKIGVQPIRNEAAWSSLFSSTNWGIRAFIMYQQLSKEDKSDAVWIKEVLITVFCQETALQHMSSSRHMCCTQVHLSLSTGHICKSWQSFLVEYWTVQWHACLCADLLVQGRGSCTLLTKLMLCPLKSCWLELGWLWKIKLQWKNQLLPQCNLLGILGHPQAWAYLLLATSAIDPIISQGSVCGDIRQHMHIVFGPIKSVI